MEISDVTKYIDMGLRRKYWLIIPFLFSILGGLFTYLYLPKSYEANTLILVQPQKVPEDFVRSIVSSDIEDRLRTITQQVTSRTNLEKIIGDYNLFTREGERDLFPEEKVELFKKRIKIDVAAHGRSESNAFSIAFRGEDPQKVMQVTNALASNFISENLKIRESQAMGTSSFLDDELADITKRLEEKEEKLKQYRLNNMGALPEQLQTNLSILTRLQTQLEQLGDNLRDAENRKLILQQQISDTENLQTHIGRGIGAAGSPGQRLPTGQTSDLAGGLENLKNQLSLLESKYTPDHPDVIRLKATIKKLTEESQAEKQKQAEPGETPAETSPQMTERDIRQNTQTRQIDLEIRNTKQEIKDVQARVKIYQNRVEETPKREQELLTLNRDYENLKALYNSMLNRKLEADIAVNMEKKQKGEQFRIIDPAKVPNKPVSPDMKKIMLMALALGLGLGGGLVYLLEFTDSSFKDPTEVEKMFELPILVNMPIRFTKKEQRNKIRKEIIIACCIALLFVASLIGVFHFTIGLQEALQSIAGRLG